MEEFINKAELEDNQIENLPLFFKKIYYNDMSSLIDEEKLMIFNSKFLMSQMRHFEPNRIICKSIITRHLSDKNDE